MVQVNKFFTILALGVIGIIFNSFTVVAENNAKEPSEELVEYEIFNLIQSKTIVKSLTGKNGSEKRGEALMVNRKKGNCVACHSLDMFEKKAQKDPNTYGDMGEIGPTLDGVASRYKEGQLRLMLVNAKLVFPDTMMPAFYEIKGLTRVQEKYLKKPILKAQEIEDILSFLMKLK